MQDFSDIAGKKKVRAARGSAVPASNVWPIFGKKDFAGRRLPLNPSTGENRVDNGDFVRHDASHPVAAKTVEAGQRASPKRRHAMPRLAREALFDQENSNRSGTEWSPLQPASQGWGQAPGDPVTAQAAHAAQDRHNRLTRTLEVDIIPRLANVHRAMPIAAPASEGSCAPPTTQDVESFVQLVLAREHSPAQAFVEVLCQRGMSVETIYLDLLAPSAQHLNYLWAQDLCDFTQVTLGLARLQRLLHEFSPALRGGSAGDRPFRGNARRVLLLPACGEQQTFGLSMVAEFFHQAGWEVDCGTIALPVIVTDIVQGEWFDVIGLSAGSETKLDGLRRSIRDIRHSSRNKEIGVLVGGPIFAGHPERVKFVGADASGLDGKQAPAHAEKLIAPRGRSQ